ncbi:hypothetical protein DRH14_05570 [Candidatus Shapirobacteria bacterium]|nr:MAG: hypothetical protein DRH14_05570 [Candidatus Shapirobacteria bacterium]
MNEFLSSLPDALCIVAKDSVKFCTTKGYPRRRRMAVWRMVEAKLKELNYEILYDAERFDLLQEFILCGYNFQEERSNINWKNPWDGNPPYKETIINRGYRYYKPFSMKQVEPDGSEVLISSYSKIPWYVTVTWYDRRQFTALGFVPKEDLKYLAPKTYSQVSVLEERDEENYRKFLDAQAMKSV